MPVYKKKVTKTGKENFFKDGKALKRHLVPEAILNIEPDVEYELFDTETNAPVETTPEVPAYDGPVSAISGEPATRRKWLNQQVYWLTEEEYQRLSLGKLAQAIREKEAAKTVAE